MADREGDLRALIDAAARRGASADGLIRSKHNRKTTTGEKRWARLAQSEALGEVEFALPARQVRQTLTHGGDAAGASRPTRRDHDRDPGSRGTPAGRREGDRVAAVDPPDRRDPGAGGRTRGRVDGYRRRLVRLIAGFGGFLGRKHDGHPDPKAIWEGMQKVRAFAITLEASRAAYTSSG